MKGSVYKRKDGLWLGRVELPPDQDGKRRRKCIYAHSRQECQRRVNELIYKLESGMYTDSEKLTVDGYLENWYTNVHRGKIEATTREGYENILHNHLIPYFQGTKLKAFLPLHIEEYYNSKRRSGLSNNTLQKHHAFLSKAFNDAVKNRIIPVNPCSLVDKPKPNEFDPNVPSLETYFDLLELSQGTEFEAAVLLMGMCGHRRGEAIGAKKEDFIESLGICLIKRTVAEVKREVIEGDSRYEIIESRDNSKKVLAVKNYPKSRKTRKTDTPQVVFSYVNSLADGKYIIGQSDKPVSPGNYFKRYEYFLKSHGFEHFNFHSIRHFYGTSLMEAGIPLRVAQDMLGHSTITMTMKYQHPSKDTETISKIENYFSGHKIGSIVEKAKDPAQKKPRQQTPGTL